MQSEEMDEDGSSENDGEELEEHMNNPQMRAFLKAIDLIPDRHAQFGRLGHDQCVRIDFWLLAPPWSREGAWVSALAEYVHHRDFVSAELSEAKTKQLCVKECFEVTLGDALLSSSDSARLVSWLHVYKCF